MRRRLVWVVATLVAINLLVPLGIFLAHHKFTRTVIKHDDGWSCPTGYHIHEATVKAGPNQGDVLISCVSN